MKDQLQWCQQTRLHWRLLKLFPQCFAVRHDSALTQSQRAWLYGQLLLDDGADACHACGNVDTGLYCRHCGTQKGDGDLKNLECPACHLRSPGPFCGHCGTQMQDDTLEALKAGTFDWDAWRKTMQANMPPLTLQERRSMQQDTLYG